MSDTLNILHLRKDLFPVDSVEYNEAVFREENIAKQVMSNRVQDVRIWDGIIIPQMPFLGIGMAFKRIIRDAQNRGLKSCVIAEDDLCFTCPDSWNRFLETTPEDYDLYHGSPLQCEIQNNRIIFGFSSMTILRVHESFYNVFLSIKEMNNIDREIGRFAHKYKYMVADPFIATQLAGYSYHQKKVIENYDHLFDGVALYRG